MMSYLTICQYPLEELKLNSFEIQDFSENFLINGWSAPERNWIWSLGESAYLAFRLPGAGETQELKIRLQGALFAEDLNFRNLKFEINIEEIKYNIVNNGNKLIYELNYRPKKNLYLTTP